MSRDPLSFLNNPAEPSGIRAPRAKTSRSRHLKAGAEAPGVLQEPDVVPLPGSVPLGRTPRAGSTGKGARFTWLPKRIGSIKGALEDSLQEPWYSERNLMGLLGSSILHALILLLIVLFVLFIPKKDELIRIDSSLGSTLGSEDGLDRLGGFEDDLLEQLEIEPLDLQASTLLEPLEPQLNLDASRLVTQTATAKAEGQGSGGGAEFGVARFGNGLVERIQGVDVKVGDPQFTLIWDSQADIDLHVLEPGGSHIYWEVRNGQRGGELDVDDVDGFGPENIYWVVDRTNAGEVVKGRGPRGKYQWYVHYYGGHGGISVPTRWKVRLKQGGRVEVFEGRLRRIGDRSSTYSFELGSGTTEPSGEGEGTMGVAVPSSGLRGRGGKVESP